MFVVTGGGRGLGRALAYALADRGQPVLIVGRDEAALVATAAMSSHITYLRVDVTLSADRARLNKHLDSSSSIQGLVHNAGIIEPILPITDISESEWRQCMATNLDAPLFLTQLLKDKLQQGRVLHISSGAAYFPVAGWAAYCASKAALSMLNQCWQLECETISFASVMPGIIDTSMQKAIRHAEHMAVDKRDFFKRLKKTHRLLSTETVAAFLCWLLLDVDKRTYTSKEWDIYDKTHHSAWLFPPYEVLEPEEI